MEIKIKPKISYKGNGTQKSFTFPFDYLRKSFVNATVNKEKTTAFTINGKELTFSTAPSLDADVVIYRSTDTERLVSWADASVLHAKDMTIQQVQELHILEEQQQYMEDNSLLMDEDNTYFDARGLQVKNVANGTDPKDAVNKEQLDVVDAKYEKQLKETADTREATEQAKIDAQNAANVAVEAKNTVFRVAPQYERAEQALVNIDQYHTEVINKASEASISAYSAKQASDNAIDTLRNTQLIANSGNADKLTTQNATDITGLKSDISRIKFSLAKFSSDNWTHYSANSEEQDDGITTLNGYIRPDYASYHGSISPSDTRLTYYKQMSQDVYFYCTTRGTPTNSYVRISVEQPVVQTGLAWLGEMYNASDFPTIDNPLFVKSGMYIAICASTILSTCDLYIIPADTVDIKLKDTLPLTEQMTENVKEIIGYTGIDYLKYAMDKVLCIGDSLTAGSSYEKLDDGTLIWLGNIKQNYPYFLSRILNTTCVNGGDGGETTITWYRKHFAQYDYSQFNTVIIFLGTNGNFTDTLEEDVNQHSSYSDYAETNTGIYCKMIEQIREVNSECQIIMVNYYSSTAEGKIGRSVLPKIAEKYNLPIIQTDEMETTKGAIYHGFTGNVHLAKYGYLYLANKIASVMSEWFAENPSRVNFGREVKDITSDTSIE